MATDTDYVLMSVAGTITGTPTAAPVWDVAPVNAAAFQVVVIGNNVVLRQITGTPPSVVGSVAPATVNHFDSITVSVTVTPGSHPISTVDLNAVEIGGVAVVPLIAAGGYVYTNTLVVGAAATMGTNTLPVTVTDTALLAAGVNLSVVVVGTNRTWNGAGTDPYWSTLPNWLHEKGPGKMGDSITFAGEANLFPLMEDSYSVTGMTFDGSAGSFTVSGWGGTLTLAGSGLSNSSTNAQTLDLPVAMVGTQTFDAGSGDMTVGQAVSGSGNLIKSGSSNLTLSANASYTGPTTINGGTLTVSSRIYVTAATVDGPVTINSGGILSLPAGSISLGGSLGNLKMPNTSMVINGGTLRHTGSSNTQTSGGAARLFTIGALGATLDSATAGQTFSIGFRYDFTPVLTSAAGGRLTLTGEGDGVLDYSLPGSGGLTKTGMGTWTMSGSNNTYTGSTIIQEGTLNFNRPVISLFTTVVIQTNTVLNLNFAETNAIGGLVLDGVSMPPGVYDATTSAPYIQGTGSLLVRTGPIASFTMAPTSGVSMLTVSFTNTSSGTPLGSVLWTFGDGGVSTATNMAPLAVTYKYTNQTCTVTTNFVVLKVDNGAGISTWTNPTPVVVYPAAPVAGFGVDNTNVAAATPVTFTNLAGGCVATALWNFGDGNYSTSTGLTVTHAYAVAGTNQVTLAVTNAYGYGTVSSIKTVVVTNQSSVVGIPHITSIQYQGSTNVMLVGTNVANGIHTYYVLGSTDAAQPRSSWQSLATNQCNADGSFSISVPVRGADQFYLIQVPQP